MPDTHLFTREAPLGTTPMASMDAVERMPAAAPRRHRLSWNRIVFGLSVILPIVLAAIYVYGFASDQYVSEFRFRLRNAQTSRLDSSSASLMSSLTGTSGALEAAAESEIVVQYLESRQVLEDIKPAIDLDRIYGRESADWYARLSANEPIEEKVRYWHRVADPFYDASTGIVTVKIRAFEPGDARVVSAAVLAAAEKLVNTLSDRANADRLAYARATTGEKLTVWKNAEVALREFRNANGVLFPNMQAGESTGLDGNLRAAESKTRAALDTLRLQGVAPDAPQVRSLTAQMVSIQTELRRTQAQITRPSPATGPATGVLPLATLVTTYEGLDVDAKIASKAYELAIMAEQRARDEANQQRVYLDAFVQPAEAQKSLYPVRWRMLLEVAAASFAAWCLGTLLYRAIMDHID